MNRLILKRIYFVYRLLIILITFAFFLHINGSQHHFYNVAFLLYFLDVVLFLGIDNRYFELFSLIVDVIFAYFLARVLGMEELIMFSIAPLFISYLLLGYAVAITILAASFIVVLFYSDINAVFAIISYIAAFFSSYLLHNSIKQKELIEKKMAFDKEFKDRIEIAKRLSLEFAHEIRNPLMGISGAVEMLKDTEDKRVIKDMISIIQQEIERANNLTKDFLNLEKPYELNMTKLDICLFLKHIAERRKGIVSILVECKSGLTINADKDMLERMFDNLIRNAIEADSSVVNIVAQNTQGYIEIQVSDNGRGIDIGEADTNDIFMPFFTTKQEGSGLGLAICRQIAQAHNGDIRVLNQNTFKIELKGN